MTLTEANNKKMWSNETTSAQVLGRVLAYAAISSGLAHGAIEVVHNKEVRVITPCPSSCSTHQSVELSVVSISPEPTVPQHINKMLLLRKKAIGEGMKLLSRDEILEEISRDRGELG